MAAEGGDSEQMETDEDSDEVPPPVKLTSLKNFVKQHSDKRAGSDAIDLLQSHLEFTAERLWLDYSRHPPKLVLDSPSLQVGNPSKYNRR